MKEILWISFLVILLSLGGCAKQSMYDDGFSSDGVGGGVNDPLEPLNRVVFDFNNTLNDNLLFPIADAYEKVVPESVRKGVGNFFHNLATPIRIVSDLLQFKGNQAVVDLTSFPINTIFGLGGIFDVYLEDNKCDDEDVSQAIASWGIGAGPYIVWPIFGPSTLRNTVGEVGNICLSPQTYLGFPTNAAVNFGKDTNNISLSNPYREIVRIALDPYVGVREAYLHNFKLKVSR